MTGIYFVTFRENAGQTLRIGRTFSRKGNAERELKAARRAGYVDIQMHYGMSIPKDTLREAGITQ